MDKSVLQKDQIEGHKKSGTCLIFMKIYWRFLQPFISRGLF